MHLTFYIHKVHTNGIKKEYTNVSTARNIHIMLYMEVGTKMEKKEKKLTWWWLYHFLAESETISSLIKEQKQKRSKMGFWDFHVTHHEVPYGHTHSLGEIIVCLSVLTFPKNNECIWNYTFVSISFFNKSSKVHFLIKFFWKCFEIVSFKS